jgi:hypothetical protein
MTEGVFNVAEGTLCISRREHDLRCPLIKNHLARVLSIGNQNWPIEGVSRDTFINIRGFTKGCWSFSAKKEPGF